MREPLGSQLEAAVNGIVRLYNAFAFPFKQIAALLNFLETLPEVPCLIGCM